MECVTREHNAGIGVLTWLTGYSPGSVSCSSSTQCTTLPGPVPSLGWPLPAQPLPAHQPPVQCFGWQVTEYLAEKCLSMVGKLEVETRREEGVGVGEEAPLQVQVDKKGLKFSDRSYSNIIHACIDMAPNTTQVLSSMGNQMGISYILSC